MQLLHHTWPLSQREYRGSRQTEITGKEHGLLRFTKNVVGRGRSKILFRISLYKDCWSSTLRTKLSDTICSGSNFMSKSWGLTLNHMWSRVSKHNEGNSCVMRFIMMVNAKASIRSCPLPPRKSRLAYALQEMKRCFVIWRKITFHFLWMCIDGGFL